MGGALEMMIPTVTDMKFWNKLGAQFALFANKLFKKEGMGLGKRQGKNRQRYAERHFDVWRFVHN